MQQTEAIETLENLSKSRTKTQNTKRKVTKNGVFWVLTRATRRNNPEDTILHSHRRENLKSYTEK
jgi:hypothetical protein